MNERATKVVAPSRIARRGDKTLVVEWNDGEWSEFDVRQLRLSCPCAACVNEWTGERMLKDESVPQGVRPVRIGSVGRYALSIHWSDGHSTGIYSHDYLRKLGTAG